MRKVVVVAGMLAFAASTFADAPGKGDFGFGVTLTGSPLARYGVRTNDVDASIQGLYWATERLQIDARAAFVSGFLSGQAFQPLIGANYFFVKDAARSLGVYAGGLFGLDMRWPQNSGVRAHVVAQAGLGGEYFFTKNFSVQLFEGAQYSASGTDSSEWFGLATQIGLHLYF